MVIPPFRNRISLLTLALFLGVAGTSCRDKPDPVPECGDGVVEGDELCDDGNTVDGDGCSADCQLLCGNGVVDDGEACDDGNLIGADGCEVDCTVTVEEIFCQIVEPVDTGVCAVTPGDDSRLIVGDILTPLRILRGGEVLVDASGQITCVGCDCGDQGGASATRIACPNGVVSPGLINSHDHITFIQNYPYNDTGERYEHRHDWRRGRQGHTEISGYSGGASADEMRWGELRFLFGGATSTVGSGSASGFVRNLDRASDQEGLNQPPVEYETFPLGDSSGTQIADGCNYPGIVTQAEIANEDAYFPHVSEGIDQFARNEFLCVSSTDGGGEDLLEPQSAFIHSIGLTPLDYARMESEGTSLIWSPRSNVTLYGNTAVVTAAKRMGVRIALGTDWIPTGSMNMQRELQCADSLNRDYFDGAFTDRELWLMATQNGAEAAAMDDAIGALEAGLVADIAIYDGAENADYRAVIDAAPEDVVMVMRGGDVLYGDDAVVTALAATSCDLLDVCGSDKRVCVQGELGRSFDQLQTSVGAQYPLFFCGTPDDEPSCKPTRPDSVNGSTVYTGDPGASDQDGDGIDDGNDNCPLTFNPIRPVDNGVQGDFDGDGDACDPCPLAFGVATDCPPFDPDDLDGDGHTNDADNCPLVPNSDQADGDEDQKGDVCDPCPGIANPGELACPTTIYDIKQGLVSGAVAVENALVTGCADMNGYFLQVKSGDAGYMGADYSGIFVYDPSVACGTTLTVGDRVTLNPATVNDFFGQIQLGFATVNVLSSGEAAPEPVLVTPAQAGGQVPTPLESVLVTVENVLVTELEPPAGPGDSNPNNEFVVDGALRVNDFLHLANPFPVVNDSFISITGILDYRNNYSKLEPRDQADLVTGPPVLIGLDPALSYVREGETGVPTIPTPLTVSLSRPAEQNTFVAITSTDPGSLSVVGGGVTVPMGSSTATVLVDAIAPTASVTLTASLDGNMRDAEVRVVGLGEVPRVAAIDPPSVAVGPQGMVSLTVYLDIPADMPAGNTVSLALAPGTFGTVPATVQVAADQVSAAFTFSAGAMIGTETVTASLNGSMASATIDIVMGGGIIINEVNYDDVGFDDGEFVEILNTTGAAVDLGGLALVLVNGNTDVEYNRVDLGPVGSLNPGEYLVIGTPSLVATLPPNTPSIEFAAADNNVQNGSPDALGILDVGAGSLIDALSYEGSVTMGDVSGVGPLNFVEGTATTAEDSNAVAGSLIRSPDGTDTDDAASDWAFTATMTPGAANVP